LYIQGWSGNWCLWCVNTSDCSINWEYRLPEIVSPNIHSSCGISPLDGTIYVGDLVNALHAINPDGTRKWTYSPGALVLSSPVVDSDGTIYVGCKDDYLYAIDSSGTLKWRYQTGAGIISSPAIGSDGTIYVGSPDQKLYAVNPDGTLRWSYSTNGSIESSPAVGSDTTIYIGSADGHLYAVTSGGNLKWKYDTGGSILSSPAIDNLREVVYVGSNAGKVCAVHANDGALKWETPCSGSGYSSPAVAYASNTVYIGSLGAKFYVMDGETGNILCSNSHSFQISSPAIDEPQGEEYCVWYTQWSVATYKVCSSPGGIEKNHSCTGNILDLYFCPEPFAAVTRISFVLREEASILLEVYDVGGRLTRRLARGDYSAGSHTIELNGKGIPKGIYFCRLVAQTSTLRNVVSGKFCKL
jgi:outer membrane protein assembly factor BamB